MTSVTTERDGAAERTDVNLDANELSATQHDHTAGWRDWMRNRMPDRNDEQNDGVDSRRGWRGWVQLE
jgi:hypothetical protein